METYTFKQVFTPNVISLQIDKNIPLVQLRSQIDSKISRCFNLSPDLQNYDIVEAGQIEREFGIPIDETSNNILGKSKGFYIRPKNFNFNSQSQSQLNQQIESNSQNNAQRECYICMTLIELTSSEIWTCNHHLNCCSKCVRRWRETCNLQGHQLVCPICRTVN